MLHRLEIVMEIRRNASRHSPRNREVILNPGYFNTSMPLEPENTGLHDPAATAV